MDEQLRAEDVEVFYDPGELLGGLLKGPTVPSEAEVALAERLSEAATVSASDSDPQPQACPFLGSGKHE